MTVEEDSEDMLMEIMDGKKRQRINAKMGISGDFRELSMEGLENDISAATHKVADRTQ